MPSAASSWAVRISRSCVALSSPCWPNTVDTGRSSPPFCIHACHSSSVIRATALRVISSSVTCARCLGLSASSSPMPHCLGVLCVQRSCGRSSFSFLRSHFFFSRAELLPSLRSLCMLSALPALASLASMSLSCASSSNLLSSAPCCWWASAENAFHTSGSAAAIVVSTLSSMAVACGFCTSICASTSTQWSSITPLNESFHRSSW